MGHINATTDLHRLRVRGVAALERKEARVAKDPKARVKAAVVDGNIERWLRSTFPTQTLTVMQ